MVQPLQFPWRVADKNPGEMCDFNPMAAFRCIQGPSIKGAMAAGHVWFTASGQVDFSFLYLGDLEIMEETSLVGGDWNHGI